MSRLSRRDFQPGLPYVLARRADGSGSKPGEALGQCYWVIACVIVFWKSSLGWSSFGCRCSVFKFVFLPGAEYCTLLIVVSLPLSLPCRIVDGLDMGTEHCCSDLKGPATFSVLRYRSSMGQRIPRTAVDNRPVSGSMIQQASGLAKVCAGTHLNRTISLEGPRLNRKFSKEKYLTGIGFAGSCATGPNRQRHVVLKEALPPTNTVSLKGSLWELTWATDIIGQVLVCV